MRSWLHRLFVEHWPRKLVAIVAAIVIWFLVSTSITVTRTISNIPVRVINIPKNMTIEGLQPNGLLKERMTLTMTGSKATLDTLVASDLEVVTDAEGRGERWTVEVTKRNLISLNPDIDLKRNLTSVSPGELTLQLSPLVTEKIPVQVVPVGDPPKGYIFLDVWPEASPKCEWP